MSEKVSSKDEVIASLSRILDELLKHDSKNQARIIRMLIASNGAYRQKLDLGKFFNE